MRSSLATGGNRGAGIGGFYQKAVGNITIEGNANVTATGGASGAGIGTGGEATGEAVIIINGGTVNASMSASNGAAAIGSGYKSEGKTTVSISGGQVTAAGSSIYGVGIGGGNTGAAEEEVVVNITGGTVNASGRAGIGTANASNAKQTINISGGMVTARGAIDGSNKCAAIGQGNNSNSVTEINITGGIVRALGTGTGIGSGTNSNQTPTINLGYTDATMNDMEITAIDYNGTVTLSKSFKYQDGSGVVSIPITANKTIVPSDSTAHLHRFTYSASGNTITATCANSDGQCSLIDHKATLTIGGQEGMTSMEYDGTAKAAVITGDTGVLTADVVYKKGNTALPSAPSDAGIYTASITLGEATATVSYEITKKPVTFSSITAKDKEYDGTTKSSSSIGMGVKGAISGDNVYANVTSGVANFDTPDVGVNKKVTFTNWELQGSSKDNYEMVQPEPQYRAITPRIITVTAKDQTVAAGSTVVSTPGLVEITSGTLVSGHSISEVTLTGDTSAVTESGTVTLSTVKILDSSNVDVTANYLVNYVAGKLTVTEAPAHTHIFTYTAFGTTITATCSAEGCPLQSAPLTLTIAVPLHTTYGDGKEAAAQIIDANGIQGGAKVQYQKKTDGSYGTATENAPTDAGDYKASITLDGATASVEYTIAKANPTADAPYGLTATYGNTLADVKLPNGWAWVDSTTNVGTVGVHTFPANFTPDDTNNYNSLSNIGVTVTVTKAANPATVTNAVTVAKGGDTVDLAGYVTKNDATGAVSYVISGKDYGCTLNGSVLTSGENTGSVIVKVTVAEDSNYNASGAMYITVTISDKPIAVVKTPPTARSLTYTGSAQALVNAGSTDDGTLHYTVTKENTASAPTDGWSDDIPTGAEIGTYYVWYKVVGDANHSDTDPVCVEVTIASRPAPYTPGKPAQDAPTGLAAVDATSAEAGDGAITGVTDAMEYSADDGKTWTKVPEGATEITGLVPGEYLVRFAETPDYNASEAVKLTVGDKSAGEAPGYDAPTYEALPEEDKQEADAIAGAHNTDKETAAQMLKYAKEHGIPLDTVKLSDAAIKALPTSDEDPAGSSFGKLTARATKRAKTAITLSWKQLDDADGYLIYGNLCNKSNKLLKTVTQKDTTKWTQKKLKKRKFYKYMVVAYKNFGNVKMPIAASVYVHTATSGTKKTLAKKVKVNKTSVALDVGETVKLKASEVKAEKKKLSKHRAIKYEVENVNVATVAADGTVTAVGEGTTTLYVYAQNGLYRIVTVTVTATPPAAPNNAEETNAAEEINAEDALTIELTEPETDETLVEIDDGTVEDNDTAQIETEIILEDEATYID